MEYYQRVQLKRLFAGVCWAYAGLLLAVAGTLHFGGDRWWFATLLQFGPRWMWGLPLPAVAVVALFSGPRLLWVVAFTALILAGPVMGFHVPWRSALGTQRHGSRLRVLTCNVHDESLDPAALVRLIDLTSPDLVALQCMLPADVKRVFGAGKWYVLTQGDFCLGSRYPIDKGSQLFSSWEPHPPLANRYEIVAPWGIMEVFNVHLESPHGALRDIVSGAPNSAFRLEHNIDHRRQQTDQLQKSISLDHAMTLLAGDFNTPSESSLFSHAFSGFSDNFAISGKGFGWTYYSGGTAARIDHILSGAGWEPRECWVGPAVGSPHRPLIADLEWTGKPG